MLYAGKQEEYEQSSKVQQVNVLRVRVEVRVLEVPTRLLQRDRVTGILYMLIKHIVLLLQ